MKENKIIIKSKNGRKTSYDVIIMVTGETFEYIIYTDNKMNKDNELNVFFAKYKEDNSKLKNVTKKEEEHLINILNKFKNGEDKVKGDNNG